MTEHKHPDDDSIDFDLPESVADVDPDVDNALELRRREESLTALVGLPMDIVTAIAYRAGAVAAQEGGVTPYEIQDLAYDHVSLAGRFMVTGTDIELVEWIEEAADVPVDHSEPVSYPERHVFDARAEYRPDSKVPLRIQLDPPAEVLDEVGGWDELTETVRLIHETDTDDA